MIEIILASAFLTCEASQELIDKLNQSRQENKEEIISVIKLNTEPTCYERPERNS